MKSYVSHWTAQRWQEYEPMLNYCRDNEVRLVACGTPLKVLLSGQYSHSYWEFCFGHPLCINYAIFLSVLTCCYLTLLSLLKEVITVTSMFMILNG